MRVIFLNSWFGTVGNLFFDFIKDEASKTDMFCFMEFTPDLFTKVSKILKSHNGFIEKGTVLESWGVVDCQVIFVKKGLKVLDSGKMELYKNTPDDTGFASYIRLEYSKQIVNIMNVHGKSRPGHKMDIPERIKQSEVIINFFKDTKEPIVIGGDFNLNPATKSVSMFEEAGYRNLIKDFKIKNTRNKLSWKQFHNIQHFADYCFVSKGVKVAKFEAPYMEISDHLPLILDFEV